MKYKLVVVVWNDVRTEDNWHPEDLAKSLPIVKIRSVGWLLYEDKKKVVISSMISSTPMFGHSEAIPSGCIDEIIEIQIVDAGPDDAFWMEGQVDK